MKLIPPKRIRIFNFSTFSSALLMETKSLEIIFHREFFDLNTMQDLEKIFTWCISHKEVKSVFISSHHNHFIQGIDYSQIKTFNAHDIISLYQYIHTINELIFKIPQTVLVDLKEGAKNEGLIFAMAADIRLSQTNARFQFDQLENGLIDASGLFSLLSNKINLNLARNFILSGLEFGVNELNQLGGFSFTDQSSNQILGNISKQSNVARLQVKNAFLELDSNIKKKQNSISKLLSATLYSADYKAEKEFINLREFQDQITN